jgi:hypothetical protein
MDLPSEDLTIDPGTVSSYLVNDDLPPLLRVDDLSINNGNQRNVRMKRKIIKYNTQFG